MPHQNAIGSWFVKCRKCGHEHRITNMGRRRAIDHDGYVVRATVHEAGCYGWELIASGDRRWHAVGKKVRFKKGEE